MREPSVTIIIPFFNEEAFIKEKILNCTNLDYPCIDEIIFVNDYSTDQSVKIFEELTARFKNIRLLQNKYPKGKSGALKTALESTKSLYVVCTDVDITLSPNAVSELINAIERNPKIGLVFGEIHRYLSIEQFLIHRFLRILAKIDSSVSCFGQFYMFRKNLNIEIDENIIADDLDVPIQVRRQDYLCKPVPSAIFHDKRASITDTAASRRRIIGIYQALLKHKTLFLNWRYGKYGLICYPLMSLFFPAMCLFYIALVFLLTYALSGVHPILSLIFLAGIFLIYKWRKLTLHVLRTLYIILNFLITGNASCKWRA